MMIKLKDKTLHALIIALRVLGIANSLSLTSYIMLTCYAISPLTKTDVLTSAYTGAMILTISASILIINIFAESKLHPRKLLITDAFSTFLLTGVLIYFSYFSRPKILSWLMPLALLLPSPIILSIFLDLQKMKHELH